MEGLSWLFFCLAPFALFCSESGNGLILCPVFIILGFVFKYAGSNGGSTPKAVVKVEPQKFWEWHYKDRMRSTLAQKDTINDGLMALKDKEARSWATTICGYHNAWVPPEDTQEQIARANGVVTEKMIKQRTEKKDRIQVGRYFLLQKLKEEYEKCRANGKCDTYRNGFPETIIEGDCRKIKLSNGRSIDDWNVKREYNKSVMELYEDLSEQEKNQIIEWAREYAIKLHKSIKEGRYFYSVDMDFLN